MINFIKELPALLWVFIAVICAIALMVIDKALSSPKISHGEVLHKKFKVHPGEFIFFVKDWSGKTIKIKCDPETFYQHEEGDILSYYCFKGISGIVYSHQFDLKRK